MNALLVCLIAVSACNVGLWWAVRGAQQNVAEAIRQRDEWREQHALLAIRVGRRAAPRFTSPEIGQA